MKFLTDSALAATEYLASMSLANLIENSVYLDAFSLRLYFLSKSA
jgi:hypothetical protein